jgi:hypothetical protein
MTNRLAGILCSCALAGVSASAQFVYNTEITGDTATVTFLSPRVFTGSGITGAPFTADRVSERTQNACGRNTHPPASECRAYFSRFARTNAR